MSTLISKKVRIAALIVTLVATLVPAFAPVSAQTATGANTYDAVNITQTSATLRGSANFVPDSEWFEIATEQNYQAGGFTNSVSASNGTGTASPLQPGTTYYYRYVAQKDGQTCFGETVYFTTAPATVVQQPKTCNASITWNTSSVTTGGSATETWSIQGADYATGVCTGLAEHGISNGPQSYTFNNLQQSMTCTVKGFINNQQACSSSATVTVTQPQQQTCQDTSASNYGQVGSCTYVSRCQDTSATNYGQVGACTYPTVQRCNDSAASNYGQVGACTYPARCQDSSATNFGQIGACTYAQRCQDTSATNYGGIGACTYAQRCQDASATNYGQVGSCTYPTRCTDSSATNYGGIGACTYAQRCQDASASNYNQVGSCIYPARCNDPSAMNYNQIGNCSYAQRCTDVTASNFGQVGSCVYLSRCTDPSASNYNGALPCQYRNQQGIPPLAITNPATNVGRNSALINGQVNANGYLATGWFEWGTDYASVANGFGSQTIQQSIGSGVGYSNLAFPLTGLNEGTTYYFRVVGQNAYGTARGQVLSFRTGNGGTIVTQTPPIVRNTPPVVVTTVTGGVTGNSCLVLTPTIQPANPLPGQEFVYSLTYRNNCPYDLRQSSLRITLPNEVSFAATSYPFLTRDLNTITYSLGTIPMNFQNTILVKGVVNANVPAGDNLMFKSDLSFLNPSNRIETVSAFLTAIVAGPALVGGAAAGTVAGGTASIFSSLFGFLTSGWFWFLLFLLLLALFILWLATRNRHVEVIEHE